MNSSISWAYLNINDDEFDPNNDVIDLKDDTSLQASQTLEKDYPSLFNALFKKSSEKTLTLNIPSRGYLGTDSTSEEQLILRAFFDDNSSTKFSKNDEKKKPIYLSKDTIDKKVYGLVCQIIKDVFDYDEDYGYIELAFDDTRGYIATDGNEEWEATICITEEGGEWT